MDHTDIVWRLRHVIARHAQRFIDGHFGNDAPRPQVSIPADEERDSDLILSRGIKEAADEIERLRRLVSISAPVCEECGEPAHDAIDGWGLCEDHSKET